MDTLEYLNGWVIDTLKFCDSKKCPYNLRRIPIVAFTYLKYFSYSLYSIFF